MKKILITAAILCTTSCLLIAQMSVKGQVIGMEKMPIIAANVYLKNDVAKGVSTDLNGQFQLVVEALTDTLVISYIGYKTTEIPLQTIEDMTNIDVRLQSNINNLEMVTIEAEDPISEQFSVTKMERLDIYFNPVAQGDPLKAITILPASTTTDETANPSLRGSSADRTRVVLNGVSIYQPVRVGQLNNQGFFSIFNPEILDKQYVYASNPPLTYGNTSAGLVEVQTKTAIPQNEIQLSASLANLGMFGSHKLSKNAFIQGYTNHQFSDLFIGLNRPNLPRLQQFYTNDAGLNFHTKIAKNWTLNSYNYAITEGFDYKAVFNNYEGNSNASKDRLFTINNLKYIFKKGVLSLNNGFDVSKGDYNFGNIKSKNQNRFLFNSLNYKYLFNSDLTIQVGVTQEYQHFTFQDTFPTFYYAMSPNAPTDYIDTTLGNQNMETYAYAQWQMNEKWNISAGIRKNIPFGQPHYLSSQLSVKYQPNPQHYFLLSTGKYHNYTTPNYFARQFNLLNSFQSALDYRFQRKNTTITAATFYKNEGGEQTEDGIFQVEEVRTLGVEFSIEQIFLKYFTFTFANTYLEQDVKVVDEIFSRSRGYNHLIKSTLQFNAPKLGVFNIAYLTRPGNYYSRIIGGRLNPTISFYEPIFSNNFNRQFDNYHRLDVGYSRYFKWKDKSLTVFCSVNNLLNTRNQSSLIYNFDYSQSGFDYYQLQSIYFGAVLGLSWR